MPEGLVVALEWLSMDAAESDYGTAVSLYGFALQRSLPTGAGALAITGACRGLFQTRDEHDARVMDISMIEFSSRDNNCRGNGRFETAHKEMRRGTSRCTPRPTEHDGTRREGLSTNKHKRAQFRLEPRVADVRLVFEDILLRLLRSMSARGSGKLISTMSSGGHPR